ncbi:MAG TPA: helix-turn-helix transcriptional regulator [Anaerolineae bacterium]|nr:helix-turn-helix transcriptional regulator [Anaerolineae bacterium]
MPQWVPVLAYALRERRLALTFTQRDLAERTGIKRGNIARLERGDAAPTMYTLFRVCAALGMKPSEAMTYIDHFVEAMMYDAEQTELILDE